MFRSDTVFIVGAGASVEVGFPVGISLRDKIADCMRFKLNSWGEVTSGDLDFFNSLVRIESFERNFRRVAAAANKIAGGIGFTSSVDTFLEIHNSDIDIQVCAKSAICKLISEHERRSPLYVNTDNIYNVMNTSSLKDAWLQELSPLLFERIDLANLRKAFEPVKFICFNYDRCIEWYVFNALKGLYFLDDTRASEVARHLVVLHPYGTIGDARWISRSSGVDYGADVGTRVAQLHGLVRTFTEQSQGDVIDKIQDSVRRAHTLVFLGFSFNAQNMDILRSEGATSECSVKRIFGTRHGMSDRDMTTVERQLKKRFSFSVGSGQLRQPSVDLADLKCAEFMRQYRRSLSA